MVPYINAAYHAVEVQSGHAPIVMYVLKKLLQICQNITRTGIKPEPRLKFGYSVQFALESLIINSTCIWPCLELNERYNSSE